MPSAVTSARTNAATVSGVYAAFGKGDVPAILAALDDDVSWDADWADNFAQRGDGLGHLRPRRGRDGVAAFLAELASYEFHDFQVTSIFAADQYVAAMVTIDLSTPDGGRLRDEELHLWTFDAAGKVVSVRHYLDTAKHLAAGRGEDTTTPHVLGGV